MQKVIRNYAEGGFVDTFRNRYSRWKFAKPKHNYYVQSRRHDSPILDEYDEYIIANLMPGKTYTYDTAGYYLDRAVDQLTVIELNPIVKTWYNGAVIDTGEESVQHLYGTAANFIVNNTIKLRWKTFDEFTEYWNYQTRFFADQANIFFSFRDIFVFHNRLKYKFSDLLREWLTQMEPQRFKLVNLDHKLIPVDGTMTELHRIPEIDDMINGNVKIHWHYQR